MNPKTIHTLLQSRARLPKPSEAYRALAREQAAEGGCGVIGLASTEQVAGRHLLQALDQMRNRGNGKGGGIAAVGLAPEEFGVTQQILDEDYLIAVAYLDPDAQAEVEARYIHPTFEVDHVREQPHLPDWRALPRLEVAPPRVVQYFVRVREDVRESFLAENALDAPRRTVEDEIVYQNTYRLNAEFYAATGETRAFVLSHGKNLLVLKMVGYGDDVVRYYRLEDTRAHVWIGHHRYPTKGRVWHPGGAHPFIGLNEALVHNGDFANYASIAEYLRQRNIHQLYLTDTEVSVQVFDLLRRTYGYPLEYVIEAIAPTTERDFTLLPPEKQRVYQMLQTTHMHCSPDGPWFFLIAQSEQEAGAPVYRLTCITDTSMLRPQVFALQRVAQDGPAIGFAASEKQGIDAALASLAEEDPRFWPRADKYWNARGGSHTDGGAFIFSVRSKSVNRKSQSVNRTLVCTDKFGREVRIDTSRVPYSRIEDRESKIENWKTGIGNQESGNSQLPIPNSQFPIPKASPVAAPVRNSPFSRSNGQTAAQSPITPLPNYPITQLSNDPFTPLLTTYSDFLAYLQNLERAATTDAGRAHAIQTLTLLMDRRYPTGALRRSSLLALADASFARLIDNLRANSSEHYHFHRPNAPIPHRPITAILDARAYPPEGSDSLASEIVKLYKRGCRKFIVAHCRGHRFIGNGLGPDTRGVRIDVYGSPGDYLASGIDGLEIHVHNNAQDQLAQIMKSGKLVVYGDVGQTFMYGAKGGEAYVLGNAAGRPLINAVGRPRVVINGTALDYLAESFMAGDPHNGGGFVILNGIRLTDDGEVLDLDTPYPGGNLFSLASGGAIYVRDPHRRVTADQLNGGEFYPFEHKDWVLIEPYLEENERLFGIPVERLLEVDGETLPPERVYRKIGPAQVRALQAEEVWVGKH